MVSAPHRGQVRLQLFQTARLQLLEHTRPPLVPNDQPSFRESKPLSLPYLLEIFISAAWWSAMSMADPGLPLYVVPSTRDVRPLQPGGSLTFGTVSHASL